MAHRRNENYILNSTNRNQDGGGEAKGNRNSQGGTQRGDAIKQSVLTVTQKNFHFNFHPVGISHLPKIISISVSFQNGKFI